MHMALTSSHCFNRINLSRTIALHREAAASSAASTTETASGGTPAPASEFRAVKDVKESVEPMSAVRLDQASEAQWRAVGYSAVLNGSVAVVTLAGGQGESVFRRATVRAGVRSGRGAKCGLGVDGCGRCCERYGVVFAAQPWSDPALTLTSTFTQTGSQLLLASLGTAKAYFLE
jgi:hypothetical protein